MRQMIHFGYMSNCATSNLNSLGCAEQAHAAAMLHGPHEWDKACMHMQANKPVGRAVGLKGQNQARGGNRAEVPCSTLTGAKTRGATHVRRAQTSAQAEHSGKFSMTDVQLPISPAAVHASGEEPLRAFAGRWVGCLR